MAPKIQFSSALAAAILLAGCGNNEAPPPSVPALPTAITVNASDEIGDLKNDITGLAFWTHPNVAFNSLVIAVTKDGLVSFNIEDGSEVARFASPNLSGAALSYFGFDADAIGIVVSLNSQSEKYAFFVVDNATRSLNLVDGGPDLKTDADGFCLGRERGAAAPLLAEYSDGDLTVRTLVNSSANSNEAIPTSITTSIVAKASVTKTIKACTIDETGAILVATADGMLHRFDVEAERVATIGATGASEISALTFLTTLNDNNLPSPVIAILDALTGNIIFSNITDARPLGVLSISPIENFSDEPQSGNASQENSLTTMSAISANLGGLYRDGAIAAVAADSPSKIRLTPVNGAFNLIGSPRRRSEPPRGVAPNSPVTDDLIIDIRLETVE